jgi:hypothetical protein
MKTGSVSRSAFSNLHALVGLVVFASALPNAVADVTFNNRIVNAGFETGSLSPWVIVGTQPTPVVTTYQPFFGTHSALLGG